MAYSLNLNLPKTIEGVDPGHIVSKSQSVNPTTKMLFQVNNLPAIQNQHSTLPQVSTEIIEVIYYHLNSLVKVYKIRKGLLKAYSLFCVMKTLDLSQFSVVQTTGVMYYKTPIDTYMNQDRIIKTIRSRRETAKNRLLRKQWNKNRDGELISKNSKP